MSSHLQWVTSVYGGGGRSLRFTLSTAATCGVCVMFLLSLLHCFYFLLSCSLSLSYTFFFPFSTSLSLSPQAGSDLHVTPSTWHFICGLLSLYAVAFIVVFIVVIAAAFVVVQKLLVIVAVVVVVAIFHVVFTFFCTQVVWKLKRIWFYKTFLSHIKNSQEFSPTPQRSGNARHYQCGMRIRKTRE